MSTVEERTVMYPMRTVVSFTAVALIAVCHATPDLGSGGRAATPVEERAVQSDVPEPPTGEVSPGESSGVAPTVTGGDLPTTTTGAGSIDIVDALDALDAVEQPLGRFENDVDSIELEEEGVNP